MTSKLRILGINAHPHDFTHYAGTLGIHASQGDEVTVISMTAGANVHNEKLAAELMKSPEQRDPDIMNRTAADYTDMKIDELQTACSYFGIRDVRMLDFPEPFRLTTSENSIDALKAIILEIRPHIMITQSPYLLGQAHDYPNPTRDDHTEPAFASLEARSQASIAVHGMTVPPHKIAVTYYPGVYFQRNQLDFVVDISDWFDQRVKAEETYISQGHTPEWSFRRMDVTLGNLGFMTGVKHAEGFVREKFEMLSGLPVPDSAIRDAEASHEEMVKSRLGN